MLLIRQRQSVPIVQQLHNEIQQQPTIQLLTQQITILQLTQQQLQTVQRHVNVVRLVLAVVPQEAVVATPVAGNNNNANNTVTR